MVNAPLPKIKDLERLAATVFKTKDINISLECFISCISKNKDLLELLTAYNMITKDDLRMNFGISSDRFPNCDSDLEDELLLKQDTEADANNELLLNPLINVIFQLI